MSTAAPPPDETRLRPAGRATRAAIEEAGRLLFGTQPYEDVSVRAIAAAAGVDPALVIRHFGSKEALFLRCVDTSQGIGVVLAGPVDTLGRRLVDYFLQRRESGIGKRHAMFVQAAGRPHVREELNRHTRLRFVDVIAPRLDGPDAELRVALMVAQLSGFLSMLFIQEDPLVTEADPDQLVRLYGDGLQRLLTG